MSAALITGASRGIGRGIALALAREGFNIIINYAKNASAAEEVRKEVEKAGAKAVAVQGDIASSQARKRLVNDAWVRDGVPTALHCGRPCGGADRGRVSRLASHGGDGLVR